MEITLIDKSVVHGFLQNDGILEGTLRHFSNGKLSNITDAVTGKFIFTNKMNFSSLKQRYDFRVYVLFHGTKSRQP